MKDLLIYSWTTRKENPGGHETGYEYLKQHFNTITISPNDRPVIIKDAGCPMHDTDCDISYWGNPFALLYEKGLGDGYQRMSEDRLDDIDSFKVANSNFMAHDMSKINWKPDAIIPTGVDMKFFYKYLKIVNLKSGLFVGSKNEVKNWSMMQKLIKKFPDIHWSIVTKDMNLSKEKMREVYNCASFFILTSPVEGCSNAIFEAMACGLPCIVSKTGYFWDFWDDRVGIRVDYDNFEQHCDAVENILKIKTDPKQVLIDQKLDLKTWLKRWGEVIEKFK